MKAVHGIPATLALLALTLWSAPAPAQQPTPPEPHCPLSYGQTDANKSHTLFLYFPTADDPGFDYQAPVQAFDGATLNSALSGNTGALIDRIGQVVADDYCEFNVQVKTTRTNPVPDPSNPPASPPFPERRVTVAIGADTNSSRLWGLTAYTDTGDQNNVDFSRVWAGYYKECEGGNKGGIITTTCPPPATGELTGNNATVDRWALAIGGTAAHEAGHTYGLDHPDENPMMDPGGENGKNAQLPGEDDFHHHLMPSGNNLAPEDRVLRRHFSNFTFGMLATNLGLSIQTMHNWDLLNPNQVAGHSLSITFLSSLPAASIDWSYHGAESPWKDPVVQPLATQGQPQNCQQQPLNCQAYFKGTLYYQYRITWSTANPAYNGGLAGVITGGGRFHIGTTFTGVDFNQPDAIIIQDVTLYDARGNALPLHPRLPMYNTGSPDSGGGFALNLYTPPKGAPLILEQARIYQLPRVASIESMIGKGVPRTFDGQPIEPWRMIRCNPGSLADGRHCVFAHTEDQPHVLVAHHLGEPNVIDCSKRASLSRLRKLLPGGKLPEPIVQHEESPPVSPKDSPAAPDTDRPICAGVQRDPFPSATVYMIATFVDPKVRHYDAARRRYVTGPVRSKLFYQFAGVRHPEQIWNHHPDADRRRDQNRDRDRDQDH